MQAVAEEVFFFSSFFLSLLAWVEMFFVLIVMNELVVLQDSTVGTGLEAWKLQRLGSDGQVGCTQLSHWRNPGVGEDMLMHYLVFQLGRVMPGGHVSAILLLFQYSKQAFQVIKIKLQCQVWPHLEDS